MEIYSTEEQQIEAIKRFLRENGLSIVAGIVLGLGGLYGYRHYQATQLAAAEGHSAGYTTLTETLQDPKADKSAFPAEAQKFIDANKDSSYAAMAALLSAKELVMKKDFAAAEQQLAWVIANNQQPEIMAVAQLRLARVQAEQKKFPEALKTLEAKLPGAFAAQQLELKGDVLNASGDAAGAKAAYQAAKTALGTEQNPLLDVKMNELAHVAG
ncbi:MAG TPA: hypothetical protein DCS87_09910 [Rheinheimera sp.]|nr:hypothetical protein [Rheinheimera sp.]